MAASPRIIAVDIGAGTIKVAEFQIPREGVLHLGRYGINEMALDPNKEENRAPFISQALTELLRKMGIKGGHANVSISGNSVFLRFVKLPPVDAIQVEQMIGFEAQQNVPFPIEDVSWDYQFLSSRGTGGEAEAIIVAIKADLLEQENSAIEKSGLTTEIIDVAPLALYNAFRYNQGTEESCSLLIDIGARTTNLLFIEKEHLFTRSIPIAGNLISQNICNEFQEPFVAAEALKKGKGFVGLGGAYADPDDQDAARISKLIRTVMTRLHNEINRSITFYRTQQGGTAPRRVFLTGGTSQLPYVDIFLAEKLGLPVEYFNPLRNVTLAPTVDHAGLPGAAHSLGEVVGLALRSATSCPSEIRLKPALLQERERNAKRRPYLLGGLVAWIVLFSCLNLYYYHQIQIVQAATSGMEQKKDDFKSFEAKLIDLEKQEQDLSSALEAAHNLNGQRTAWVSLLNDINQRLPVGVWITQLTPAFDTDAANGPGQGRGNQPPGRAGIGGQAITRLVVKGLFESSLQPSIVNQFVQELAKSDWFVINPDRFSEVIVSVDSSQDPSRPLAFNFTLNLKLKKPIEVRP